MAKSTPPALEDFLAQSRKEWRDWLSRNHDKKTGVWLVYYKKSTGLRSIGYDEAVEEALCYGWIDSLPRKMDEQRSALKFSPRKPGSVWSELNKKRVSELIQKKQMRAPGLAKIKLAQKDGSWDLLTASDRQAAEGLLPEDLQQAFEGKAKAYAQFQAFSRSVRKQFLSWIDSAKRTETRQARIQQTVLMSAAGKKPGPKGFVL